LPATDQSGKKFKKGEAGYDTCLSGIKSSHDLNKKDKNDGNSASFNFKIGD
jgi:F420-0:gamma-glutamyl ligase